MQWSQNGVRIRKVVGRLLGVEGVVVEALKADAVRQELVLVARPRSNGAHRCPECNLKCPRYDRGGGMRRWRALNIGSWTAWVEAGVGRVLCPTHGVRTASVPWARPGSGFTRGFEEVASWLVARTSKSAVCELLGIAWRTVGAIIERALDEAWRGRDALAGLKRIGIDEVSYRKGHHYLTVVRDHDTGRIVWADVGRDSATLARFFDELGPERSAQLEAVSADAAPWIAKVVRARCGQAKLCIDPFHVVAWANDALDKLRRRLWNTARKSGAKVAAAAIKGDRFVVCKNPEDLTEGQKARLSAIAAFNGPLYRAYLLKELLRQAIREKGQEGVGILKRWISWAVRCRFPEFTKLAKTIKRHRAGIEDALLLGLANAGSEATNNGIRLLTRLAYGFHSPRALIALMRLKFGGVRIPLPFSYARKHS